MASSGNKQVVDLFTALSFNTEINFLLAVLYLSKGWNGEVIRTLEVLLFCPCAHCALRNPYCQSFHETLA